MPSAVDVLAALPLFASAPKKDLARLAKDAHERTFPAGSVLTGEDEFGSIFTVVVDGRATVAVRGRPVRTVGPGDFFGEMALIDREPRSATVTAETDLHCLMFTQWTFRPFALAHPETAWALLELMVRRIREAETREP